MKLCNDYRMRLVLVVFVAAVVFSDGTANADFTFGEPTNLGPTINSSVEDGGPSISADGLSLFFYSFLKGFGNGTLRMAKRETTEAPWGQAVNLASPPGGAAPCISADGLSLYLDFVGGGYICFESANRL